MSEIDLNRDIGKLAERLGKVETKLSAFEEYTHQRHHDIVNMIQNSDAKSELARMSQKEQLDQVSNILSAHTAHENEQIKNFGKWLIRSLLAAILILAGYIWKNHGGH